MKFPDPDIFRLHAEFCKTLSHPKRLMILAMLGVQEMSVGKMAESMDISMTNTSQHLAVLRSRHIVISRKEGQTVYYRLMDERLITACNLIRTVLIDEMKRRGVVADGVDPINVVTED